MHKPNGSSKLDNDLATKMLMQMINIMKTCITALLKKNQVIRINGWTFPKSFKHLVACLQDSEKYSENNAENIKKSDKKVT